MNAKTIYRFAERQPEFPCWFFDAATREWRIVPSLGWWQSRDNTRASWTHWCQSPTRPTVEPEAELTEVARLRAELEKTEAELAEWKNAAQQGHGDPCKLGSLCPYCEIDRLNNGNAFLAHWVHELSKALADTQRTLPIVARKADGTEAGDMAFELWRRNQKVKASHEAENQTSSHSAVGTASVPQKKDAIAITALAVMLAFSEETKAMSHHDTASVAATVIKELERLMAEELAEAAKQN